MMFRPLHPTKVMGFTLQGLFLKRQKEVARDYADLISRSLLTPANMMEELFRGTLTQAMLANVSRVENLLLTGNQAFQINTTRFANIDASGQLSVGVAISTQGSTSSVRLVGSDFNDLLAGGDAADVLLASAGNDTLQGGAGADSLTGGAGADTFVIAAQDSGTVAAQFDVITDLAVGDEILLKTGGLNWRAQASARTAQSLDAWLERTADGLTLYYETAASGADPALRGIQLNPSIRATGWVATEQADGLLLSIPVNTPSSVQVPASSEKLPITALSRGQATLVKDLVVLDAASDTQTLSLQAKSPLKSIEE